ncbi:hypothetical protein ES332_D06G124000v1 [Gossypium tomentosum]|uniref:Retrotransposon gag domain-containing protein n=1 Tax=Gossypium tomentosum TaxID=34277 RepID=A0A5D2KI30_GOSTO|nr:hypothetical protein ES332_D06G124000v1 [Gossypium tomentosum]
MEPREASSRCSGLEVLTRGFKMECPCFTGVDVRGWWSKLEQFFEAELVLDHAKVRKVMLYIEGKALDWHQFFLNVNETFNNRHGRSMQVVSRIVLDLTHIWIPLWSWFLLNNRVQ